MEEKFLIVNTKVLPAYFEQVVKADEMVASGEMSISQACAEMNISRSTYYKYRNKVFRPNRDYGKKSILAFKMIDEKGVLNRIVQVIYDFGINIISINQGMPIRNYAFVTITMDLSETSAQLEEIIKSFKGLSGLKSVTIVSE